MKTVKAIILVAFVSLVSIQGYAQDKRTFRGEVSSTTTKQVHGEQTSERVQDVTIKFEPRAIKIGDDSFAIVTRQFDGESTTTYTCKKGSSDFVITYAVGEYIRVQESRSDSDYTQYEGLSE